MKVFYNINDFTPPNNNVVTTGTFDGVHLGHKIILNRLINISKNISGESTLLTFSPHPRHVLFPNNQDLKLLNTQDEKIKHLEQLGINNLIIHPFTKKFSRISSSQFIEEIISQKLSTKKLVIGYDHRFGKNREGSFEHLKENCNSYGFQVEEIPAKDINQVNISSTKIRKAIACGDIKTANQFLGYNFNITGKVIHGNQIGRKIDFPTANLSIPDLYKIIPAKGVYCCEIKVENKSFFGMVNIGSKPTVTNDNQKHIEVHIFNFNDNIYNYDITISFIDKLRDEIKFNNLEELKNQLEIGRAHV